MKRIICAALFCSCALQAAALSITDPFFMPKKGQVTAEASFNNTNNDFNLGNSTGLYADVAIGIENDLTLGFGLGWADIHHISSGLQDPVLHARYRFFDSLADGYFLDLAGYLSPELFDSPFNDDGGSAKGSTSLGLQGIVGSDQIIKNVTLGAKMSIDYQVKTIARCAGSAWGLNGFGKVYINEKHSVEGGVVLKEYFFDENILAYGVSFNYAAEIIPHKLSLIPYLELEGHNRGYGSSNTWGLKAKYLF